MCGFYVIHINMNIYQPKGHFVPNILAKRKFQKSVILLLHCWIIFLIFCITVEKVKGPDLRLSKVTRADMGPYLCIASNGIPSPVSKRIMVHVHCKNNTKI